MSALRSIFTSVLHAWGVSPAEAPDSGVTVFEITGQFFGEPIAPGSTWNEACTLWEQRGIGWPVQTFGNARVVVGNAPCAVEAQNDTYLRCTTSTALWPQRAAAQEGEVYGEILRESTVEVTVALGDASTSEGRILVVLGECTPGHKRVGPDDLRCEPCPKGTFSHPQSEQWPLECTTCPPTSYQDRVGQTECRLCPENTMSVGMPTGRGSCRCIPGYYSPVLDDNLLFGLPGVACKKCHGEDLTALAVKDEPCVDVVPTASLCDQPKAHACVQAIPGTYDYRLCQVSCAGGTQWPQAMPYFYLSAKMEVQTDRGKEHRPMLLQCDPVEACDAANQCSRGYAGEACTECVFGYYRDKNTNTCMACDDSQVIGTIIMTAAAIVFSLGAFFVSLLYMKCLADPIFANQISSAGKSVVQGITRGTAVKSPAYLYERLVNRSIRVVFRGGDTGISWLWEKHRDLGMIFRVDALERVVSVAGVRPGSPARSKGISAGWKLRLLNGRALRADTEADVMRSLAKCKPPFTLTFQAPRVAEVEHDVDAGRMQEMASSGVRVVTMSLGIVQSFNSMARLDVSWPPFFTKFAAIMQQLTLNFDFFHPECSVEAPFHRKWAMFTAIPYLMILPLTCSFLIIRAVSFWESRKNPQFRDVQRWLLTNSWGRAVVTILILFIQFHMEQLVAPLSCVKREDGSIVVRLAQNIPCDLNDATYRFLFLGAVAGWLVLASCFACLLCFLYKSYYWQAGTLVRDRIPFYAAVVDTVSVGMKGYKAEVRQRVYSNIVAARTYPKGGNPWEEAGGGAGQAASPVVATCESFHDVLKSKEQFQQVPRWSDELEGNLLTYGWTLIVNTFLRQYFLMVSLVLSCQFPPIGAAGQSAFFMLNFALTITVHPYEGDLLNAEEGVLVGCLAGITWMAFFRELIQEHRRAQDYPKAIAATAVVIDVAVLVVGLLVVFTMAFNLFLFLKGLLAKEADSIVADRAYYQRRLYEDRVALAERKLDQVHEEAEVQEQDAEQEDSQARALGRLWNEARALGEQDASLKRRLHAALHAILEPCDLAWPPEGQEGASAEPLFRSKTM